MTDDPDDDERELDWDPAGAFETLGHELRLAIVEELARRQRASGWRPVPMGFEELRTAVGVDDSGLFNYHLGDLVGSYVERTDEGYVLAPAGYEVASAVLRGSHADAAVGPVEGGLDQTCPHCGAGLRAHYEDGYLRIECPEDGYLMGNTVPPAAALDRTIREIAALAERDVRRTVEEAIDGVCPECYGDIETTIPTDVALSEDGAYDEDAVYAGFECDRCGLSFFGSATALVLDHPAVVAFYHDHGIDVRERNYVEFERASETVVSEDPPRTRIRVHAGGEELAVTLDGDGGVVETKRIT